MPVEHLIPRFGDGPMRMPPVGPCTVVEEEPEGLQLVLRLEPPPECLSCEHSYHLSALTFDARQARQLAEQILFVLDGSVIVATNRVEGF